MSQEENINSETNIYQTLQEQILNHTNYTHDEITNIYQYIDQKFAFSFQSNSQSIDEINLRLNRLEDKLLQNTKSNDMNNNEISSIKQQLIELTLKVNNEKSKCNQIAEDEASENSKKIIDNKTELLDANYIKDLKCEMKQLKELLDLEYQNSQNREVNASPIFEFKDDQFSPNLIQDENYKIKTNLRSIKSEIKQIITKALGNENDATEKNPNDDIQIELAETSQKNQTSDTSNSESFTLSESQSIDQIESSQPQITKEIIETKEKVNEIKEQINHLTSENVSLKNDFNSLKSELEKLIEQTQTHESNNDSYNEILDKIIDATLAANEAQSKAIEANNNSFEAQMKADDAVFRAAEAESKAISANEKSDKIVSDNDKMNVDIKCLKYEVKKLRLRVKELEKSDTIKSSNQNDFINEIDDIKLKVNHINSDLNIIKESKIFDNESTESYDKIEFAQVKEDNENLRNEIKSIKSDVKKIKESFNSPEFVPIQEEDIIQIVKNAQTQSSHAFDKASITYKEIENLHIKTNEIIEKVNKVRTDVHNLKNDVKKMKESHSDDSKPPKKEDKKKKVN